MNEYNIDDELAQRERETIELYYWKKMASSNRQYVSQRRREIKYRKNIYNGIFKAVFGASLANMIISRHRQDKMTARIYKDLWKDVKIMSKETDKRDVEGFDRVIQKLWNSNINTISIPIITMDDKEMMLKIKFVGLEEKK